MANSLNEAHPWLPLIEVETCWRVEEFTSLSFVVLLLQLQLIELAQQLLQLSLKYAIKDRGEQQGQGQGKRGVPNVPIMLMTLEEGCKTKRLKWHSPGTRCSTNLVKKGRKYGESSKEKLQSRSKEKTSARSRRGRRGGSRGKVGTMRTHNGKTVGHVGRV